MSDPVQLRALHPGSRFRVAEGYLAPGGSSDAGVLTIAPSDEQPRTGNRIRTTDGRDLHPAMLVVPDDDEAEAARKRSEAENRRQRDWRMRRYEEQHRQPSQSNLEREWIRLRAADMVAPGSGLATLKLSALLDHERRQARDKRTLSYLDNQAGADALESRTMSDSELLRTALSAAVPLWILRVADWPFERRAEHAHKTASLVGSKGDVLMYGGRQGEAAEVFNELACAIACCAYQPGGITLFGDHYEAKEAT